MGILTQNRVRKVKHFKPTHAVKHICNTHIPTHDQKLQKSLSACQRLFCRPEKTKLGQC